MLQCRDQTSRPSVIGFALRASMLSWHPEEANPSLSDVHSGESHWVFTRKLGNYGKLVENRGQGDFKKCWLIRRKRSNSSTPTIICIIWKHREDPTKAAFCTPSSQVRNSGDLGVQFCAKSKYRQIWHLPLGQKIKVSPFSILIRTWWKDQHNNMAVEMTILSRKLWSFFNRENDDSPENTMGFSPFHFETKLHDEARKWIGKQRGFYDCGYLPLTCLQSRVTKSSTAPQVCLAVVFSSGAVTEAIQPVAAYPAKCKLLRHPGISFIGDRFTAGSLKSMSALVHRREGNGPAGLMGHPSQAPETILKHPKTMKVKADHHRKSNCKKGLLFKHVETINQFHIGFLLENIGEL